MPTERETIEKIPWWSWATPAVGAVLLGLIALGIARAEAPLVLLLAALSLTAPCMGMP